MKSIPRYIISVNHVPDLANPDTGILAATLTDETDGEHKQQKVLRVGTVSPIFPSAEEVDSLFQLIAVAVLYRLKEALLKDTP